jgi:hypothetical protein
MPIITLNVNLDEIPDLPMPISPGRHSGIFIDELGHRGQVVVELHGNLCLANPQPDCRECREYVLGMCGIYQPFAPSESQKAAFNKLIAKLEEE